MTVSHESRCISKGSNVQHTQT